MVPVVATPLVNGFQADATEARAKMEEGALLKTRCLGDALTQSRHCGRSFRTDVRRTTRCRALCGSFSAGCNGAFTASRFRSGREAGKNENRFVVTAEHGRARFAPRESIAAPLVGVAGESRSSSSRGSFRNLRRGRFLRRCNSRSITAPFLAV